MKSRSVTPGIVDKQLIDVGLDGGVDTHTRQESVDWTKRWTTLENLTNDNAECLVKRSGVSNILGTTVDDAGNTYLSPLRAVRLQNSAGFIGGAGYFLASLFVPNYQTGGYVRAGKTPYISVANKYTIGANNFGDAGSSTSASLTATAASTKYIAEAWTYYNTTPAVNDIGISIVDRETGNCLRSYQLTDASVANPSSLKMVMVDNRYLHIYVSDFIANTRYFMQVDTNSMPSSFNGIAKVALAAAANADVRSCYSYPGGSCVLYYAAGTTYAQKFNTAGAAVANTSYAGFEVIDTDSDGTTFYLAGLNNPFNASMVKIGVVATLAVTTTITDATLYYGGYVFIPNIACDAGGNFYLTVSRPVATIEAGVTHGVTDVYYRPSGAGAYTFIEKISGFISYGLRIFNGRPYCIGVQSYRSTGAGAGTTVRTIVIDVSGPSGAGVIGTRMRPEALLDDMTGVEQRSYSNQLALSGLMPWGSNYGDAALIAGFPQKVGANSTAFLAAEIIPSSPDLVNSSDGFISGAVPGEYDGYEVGETGIVSAPSVYLANSGVAGGPGAGIYNYIVIFEYVDASGQAHFSRTSLVGSITMANANQINVQVNWPSIFGRTRPQPVAARIYRTKVGGTVYYLSGSVYTRSATASGTSANGSFMTTYADAVSDATLGTRSQPYRQPGTNGTAIDRNPALASPYACRHKDRVWLCSGSTLYYSSFLVSGEAPWFNAQFTIQLYGGTGPIVAMASMDGQLVVFKKDAVFVIDGDGPPENGGTGNEFSPPRRMLTEFGCTDSRSLVATPEGLMYLSARGIELLTRSLQVTFIGEAAQELVYSFPYCTGAAYDQNRAIAMFCMASALSSRGVADTAQPGIVLAYDTGMKAWSTYKYGDQKAVQDIGFGPYPSASITPPSRYFILKGTSGVMWDTYGASFLDGSTFVPFKMESGWIKLESHQDRIRVSDIMLLAKKVTNHNITISVAYDYSDTYTHSVTFKPNEINAMDLEQLCFHVPDGAKQAVRFKIEDSQPSDTTSYPVGTGAGCEILAVSVKVGKRGGGAKLPDAQRG